MLACLLGTWAAAAEAPRLGLTNGVLLAGLYLPDPAQGYYRGTRFDWSGVIYSLKFQGHEYFGQWFARYDPQLHDAITGPVEEYRNAIGYEEAQPGGTFLRIGVGVLRKPDSAGYNQFKTYTIVDPGKWRIRTGETWAEFTHAAALSSGYAYRYTKTVRLVKGQPEMVLEHVLRNTGRKVIETPQYNHNFFVMDGVPSGPDFTVAFPFPPRLAANLQGRMEAMGNRLAYLRPLKPGESVYSEIGGFGKTASDYEIRIENRGKGGGVRIQGDRPLSKMVFWSVASALCPEPYIDLRVPPGAETRWRIVYRFYTIP